MTKEEFRKLKVGDVIKFSYLPDMNTSSIELITAITNVTITTVSLSPPDTGLEFNIYESQSLSVELITSVE